MYSLKDQKIAFFGAVGYLATPIIWKMAESGAHLIVADRDLTLAEKAARELRQAYPHQTFVPIGVDSGDYQAIDAAFQEIESVFGSLDAMVSGVSAANDLLVEEFTPEAINRTFATHVTGSFLLARNSAKLMPAGGKIVLFSSMYGEVAPDPQIYAAPMKPNPIDYGMAKAALNQMIRYLAVHWGSRNIRVNGVAPGPFPNPEKYTDDASFLDRLAQKVPLKRVGKRNEMAGAVLYLVSDESTFVNGHILNVDGGWTAW